MVPLGDHFSKQWLTLHTGKRAVCVDSTSLPSSQCLSHKYLFRSSGPRLLTKFLWLCLFLWDWRLNPECQVFSEKVLPLSHILTPLELGRVLGMQKRYFKDIISNAVVFLRDYIVIEQGFNSNFRYWETTIHRDSENSKFRIKREEGEKGRSMKEEIKQHCIYVPTSHKECINTCV